MRKKIKNCVAVCSALLILIFSSCAIHPKYIDSTYVLSSKYKEYTCDQINDELDRVTSKVDGVNKHQAWEAIKDNTATVIGLFIFWPALFLLIGEDKMEELMQLKGENKALEEIKDHKGC